MNALRLALVLALVAPAAAQTPPREPIDALILTGESTTDWRWTSTTTRALLERSGRFQVEIAPYPDATLSDRLYLRRFELLILDYEGEPWSELARQNLLELVSNGTGLVALGTSSRAFPGWEEFHAMLGVAWDDAGGADPFRPLDVEGVGRHELVEGFGEWNAHPDVLLLGMQTPPESHRALARVERRDPDTGEVEDVPVVVVGRYGQGRVVTSTLGHVSFGDPRTRESVLDPQYQQFLVRACEWAATGETSTLARVEPNTLTEAERAAGWRLLFDGEESVGWTEYGGEGLPPERWSAEDGVLVARPVEGGQVLAAEAFEEFEFEVEWRVEGGEPDVRVTPDVGVADDGRRILREPGEWNETRIVATEDGIQHWLNGVRIATYAMTPAEWAYRMTGDRPKDDPELASRMPLLQVVAESEGATVRFRDVRIRRIDSTVDALADAPPRDATVPLFNGRNLEGWTWIPWTPGQPSALVVRDGLLVNRASPPGYARTDASYGEFELEFDWRHDPVTRQPGPAALMVRIQGPRPDEEIRDGLFWPRAIEVRLGTNDAGDVYAIRKFPLEADRRRFNGLLLRRMRDMAHRVGEWNHGVIRLQGGELVVRMNGAVVNAAQDVGGQPGPVGIKAEGVPIQLRNVVLRPLD